MRGFFQRGFERNMPAGLLESLGDEERQRLQSQYSRSALADIVGSLSGTNPGYGQRFMGTVPGLLEQSLAAQKERELAEFSTQVGGLLQDFPGLNEFDRQALILKAQKDPLATLQLITGRDVMSTGQEAVNLLTGAVAHRVPLAEEWAFRQWQKDRGGVGTFEDYKAAMTMAEQGVMNVGRDNVLFNPGTGETIFERPPIPEVPDPTAGASNINSIISSFNTTSRDFRDRIVASDVALTALQSADDFAVATGLLTWLQSIGASPRVGADGQYVSESGIGQEIVRFVNQIQRGQQLTDQQRSQVMAQVRQARNQSIQRQEDLLDVTTRQLEPFNVSPDLIESLRRSALGAPPVPIAAAGAPAQTTAGTAVPQVELVSPQQNLPMVQNDQDYDQLRSGALFIDPEGEIRRKP